ncbi:MAG: hypothetical protein IBJ03_02940 [Gemmatimonadaceae bacterium]|nr:hypothetical protein [Gemmatimonadaceae bacterium]
MPPGTSLDTLLSSFATFAGRDVPRDLPRRPNSSDTDAVVQEVRARLLKAHPTGEGLSAVTAQYFLRLVTSATVELLRRQRQTPASTAHAPDEGATQLRAALGALPSSRRVPILLQLEGYSPDDTALITGWNPARVATALDDATDTLREMLKSLHGKRVNTPVTSRGALASKDLQELRAAWLICREPEITGPGVDLVLENEPTTAPEPSDIASALGGTMSEDDRLRALDRTLYRGAARELALLHHLRAAAQATMPSASATPKQPAARTAPARSTPESRRKGDAQSLARIGWVGAGLAIVAALIFTFTRERTTAETVVVTAAPVEPVAPVLLLPPPGSAVSDSLYLVWRPAKGASSYVAELVDAAGQRVLSVATVDTTVVVTLDSPADQRRVAGWAVTGMFSGGRAAGSATQSFLPLR